MKILVVSELTSTCIETVSTVLVVSKKIGRYKKALHILRVLIVGQRRSFFFYLKHLERAIRLVKVKKTRYIRKVTIILNILFYFKYSKLIYQQSGYTIYWLLHEKFCSLLSLSLSSKFIGLQFSMFLNIFKFSIISFYCLEVNCQIFNLTGHLQTIWFGLPQQ